MAIEEEHAEDMETFLLSIGKKQAYESLRYEATVL
jgi:hypothetical protein